MKLLLITPRLPSAPWSITPVVAALSRGLTTRGHRVTLLADSIEDPAMFDGLETSSFRAFSQTSTDFPFGLSRWARRALAAEAHDATLSLTRHVAADTVLPLDPTAWAWLVGHVRTKSRLGLAAHLVKHHNVAGRLLLPGLRRIQQPEIPRFSLLRPADDTERARHRRELRTALRIDHDVPLLALSATESFGRRLDPFLGAVGSLAASHAHNTPVVLALARDTFSLLRAAARATGAPKASRLPFWLRILTPTHDPRPVLLAADYAAAPLGTAVADHAATGARGRWIADALWLGTPVLAVAGAPGAELVAPAASHTPVAGLIVEGNSKQAWSDALAHALTPGTIVATRREVDRAAIKLDFGGALDSIEHALLAIAAATAPQRTGQSARR